MTIEHIIGASIMVFLAWIVMGLAIGSHDDVVDMKVGFAVSTGIMGFIILFGVGIALLHS